MSLISSGQLETDLQTIGSVETTLYIDGTTTVASGSVTVPNNVHIVVRDAGRLKLAQGCSLTIQGTFACERRQVFEYEDAATSSVVFDRLGKTELYVEWWGAKGDASQDDTDAIQRAFDCPSALDQQNEIVFTSGKTYLIKRGIRVGNVARSGIPHCSYIIRGWGAMVVMDADALDPHPAFKLGHFTESDPANIRVWQLQWLGLSVEHAATRLTGKPAPGTTGIGIANCHFAHFQGCCKIGGFETGVRYMEAGGNSNVFEQLLVTACVTGVRLGGLPDGNGWRWIGGKVQGCETGIYASGATVTIEDTDISTCRNTALKLEGVGESRFKFYTEAVSFGENNTNAVLEMNHCTNVLLQGCRINGAHLPHDNAAFGIRMRACRAVRVATNVFTRHQVADVRIAPDCEDIVLDEDNRQTTLVAAGDGKLRQITKIRVDDETHGRIHDLMRLRDLPRHHGPVFRMNAALNLIESPNVFDHPSWARTGDASLGSLTLAPDGVSQARIVRLPVAGQSKLVLKEIPPEPVQAGLTHIVLRYWWKGTAMPAQPQPRRGLRSYLQCGTQSPEWDWSYLDADGVYTGHGNWQFEEHVFTPIVGQPLAEVFFQCSDFFGGAVEVALWGVQLFTTDNLCRFVPIVGA